MPDESINSVASSNYSITPSLDYLGAEIKVKFNESCFKQDKITYYHVKIIKIYIAYEKNKNYKINSYPAMKNCLFSAVALIKNVDIFE